MDDTSEAANAGAIWAYGTLWLFVASDSCKFCDEKYYRLSPKSGIGSKRSTEVEMFTGAHLHLLVNHAPIFLSIFGLALLTLSYLAAPDVMRRTAFVVLILGGAAGILADKTGEPAEDAIRGYPGVQRKIIHDHEEMAEKAYLFAAALGVVSLVAIVRWRKRPVPGGVNAAMILASAFVGGAMIYTGLLGGRIRHTEIRPGAVKADAMTIEPPRKRPPGAQRNP